MKVSAKYAKIVEWSHEDQCYVGSAPGLILGGCHGDDEREVFSELCEIVEEAIAIYRKDGRPLPPPTSAAISRPKCRMLRDRPSSYVTINKGFTLTDSRKRDSCPAKPWNYWN